MIILLLVINLPPNFPNAPPLISLNPVRSHSWVDERGNLVYCPYISTNWTQQTDLSQTRIFIYKYIYKYTVPVIFSTLATICPSDYNITNLTYISLYKIYLC